MKSMNEIEGGVWLIFKSQRNSFHYPLFSFISFHEIGKKRVRTLFFVYLKIFFWLFSRRVFFSGNPPQKRKHVFDGSVKDISFQPFLGFGKGQKTLNMRWNEGQPQKVKWFGSKVSSPLRYWAARVLRSVIFTFDRDWRRGSRPILRRVGIIRLLLLLLRLNIWVICGLNVCWSGGVAV